MAEEGLQRLRLGSSSRKIPKALAWAEQQRVPRAGVPPELGMAPRSFRRTTFRDRGAKHLESHGLINEISAIISQEDAHRTVEPVNRRQLRTRQAFGEFVPDRVSGGHRLHTKPDAVGDSVRPRRSMPYDISAG